MAGITIIVIGIDADDDPDSLIGMRVDAGATIRTATQSGRRGQLGMHQKYL
ncbi:hypothetical protein BSLA_01r0459 [Burkholderia stabilis]|nr:hypothetical protein BSLA_01r0459 [Burkholderia stabilis]